MTVFFRQHLDEWLETYIVETGEKLLNTQISLAKTEVHFSENRAQFSDVKIHNPTGFKATYAATIAAVQLDMDLSNLDATNITITQLHILHPQIVVEQKGLSTNMVSLLEQLQHYSPTGSAPVANVQDAKPEKTPSSGKKFIVEHVQSEAGSVQLITEHYGTFDLVLPPLQLENLGAQDGGLPADLLAKIIVEQLLQSAKQVAKTQLIAIIQSKDPTTLAPDALSPNATPPNATPP